jgi:hypothetical protein
MRKALLAIAVVAALAIPSSASAAHKHNCHKFEPYMLRFQVKGIGCSKAKHVVKASIRCEGCPTFTAKHLYWHTHIHGTPSGTAEVLISGKHKRIWTEWGD